MVFTSGLYTSKCTFMSIKEFCQHLWGFGAAYDLHPSFCFGLALFLPQDSWILVNIIFESEVSSTSFGISILFKLIFIFKFNIIKVVIDYHFIYRNIVIYFNKFGSILLFSVCVFFFRSLDFSNLSF